MLSDGSERQVDVLIAADDADAPSERTVTALGEAKAGETLSERHLRRLHDVRDALGERAAGARLLLFGRDFTRELDAIAKRRADVELIDLERLYTGS